MNPCDVCFHIYCLDPGEKLQDLMATHDPQLRVETLFRMEEGWEMPPISRDIAGGAEDTLLDSVLLYKISRIHEPLEGFEDVSYLVEAIRHANRVADELHGVVYDVHGQRYIPRQELRALAIRKTFNLVDHVIVHRSGSESQASLHTHGLAKFGHPDLSIPLLPEKHIRLGASLLIDVATAMVEGMSLDPEDMLDVGPGYLRVAAGTPLPEEDSPLYGQLDLYNYDLVTGTSSPDLRDFLDGVRHLESTSR